MDALGVGRLSSLASLELLWCDLSTHKHVCRERLGKKTVQDHDCEVLGYGRIKIVKQMAARKPEEACCAKR